jgi:hypothetical protein
MLPTLKKHWNFSASFRTNFIFPFRAKQTQTVPQEKSFVIAPLKTSYDAAMQYGYTIASTSDSTVDSHIFTFAFSFSDGKFTLLLELF